LRITLRITHRLTHRELPERLAVRESLVSRDERNEYHGITVERAQRIPDALNETLTAHVDEPARRPGEWHIAVSA